MSTNGTKAKTCGLVAAFAAAAALCGGAAYAADMDNMVTKAPPAPAFTPPVSCGSLYDFFVTACPLTWSGVTLYGTVDMAGPTRPTARRSTRTSQPALVTFLAPAGGVRRAARRDLVSLPTA